MVRYGSARTLIHHKAQRGMAWLGEARLGRDSDTTQGRARLGRARHGEARRGKAGQGSDNNTPPQHSIRHAGGWPP